MRRMFWCLFYVLLCGLGSIQLNAQVTVSGHIYFGEDLNPLPHYDVLLFVPNHGLELVATTNKEGYFEAEFDWTSAEQLEVLVEVVDMCTGQIQRRKLPQDDGSYVADFRLCQGVDPPPPPAGCEAFFTYEQLSVHPPTVVFFDLSYSSDSLIQYQWDFGDGHSSQLSAPTHEYAAVGTYQVRLTIKSGNCESTMVMTVIVTDNLDCVCITVYNPVCVTLDDGTVITFSNACEAECAGFAEGDWTSCESNPCGCPEFYDPVCVDVEGDTLQFSNICFAECAGFPPDQIIACNPIFECGCTDVYAPVCVIGADGQMLTFPNACLAECAGYPPSTFVDCEGTCVCPEYYDPVCVIVDGVRLTFSNICFAQCEGYTDDQIFKCDPNECDCPQEIYEPVCVVVDGVTHTFDNPCFARCAGYTDDEFFHCTPGNCDCPEIYQPVCLVTDQGPAYWFVNACEAECAGFGPSEYEDCGPDDCVCTTVLDPVCVITPEGDSVQFDNPCLAICAGYTEEELFPCDTDPCVCTDEYDPVCVFTPGGTVLRFPNPCLARCAGYQDEHWVACEDHYCQVRFWAGEETPDPLLIQFHSHLDPPADDQTVWHWDFGDGNTSELANPSHAYAKAGVYRVQVTVTTADGCTSTYEEEIVVGSDGPYGGDCQAMFSFTQGDEPFAFQFRDRSLGQVISWQWFFGDGTTSTARHPVHVYTQSGLYIVSLSVTASDGCTSLMSMLIAVDHDIVYNPECQAAFVPFFVPGTDQVFFLNFSSPDAVAYHWDFGDGNSSDLLLPVHSYSAAGMYTVVLTITTDDGCSSTYSVTINLGEKQFTASPAYTFRTTDTKDPMLSADRLRLYPNPVEDILWVDWADYAGGRLQWRILGTDGRVWNQGQQDVPGQAAPWSISARELPPGMYYLQLRAREGVVNKAFVKP